MRNRLSDWVRQQKSANRMPRLKNEKSSQRLGSPAEISESNSLPESMEIGYKPIGGRASLMHQASRP
jgi:hypothetical protein